MRSPDPACNPYLALAVLVGSGARRDPRTARFRAIRFAGSTYDLDDRERASAGIRTLPKSLRQAIAELDKDPVVRGALGDHSTTRSATPKSRNTNATGEPFTPGNATRTCASTNVSVILSSERSERVEGVCG